MATLPACHSLLTHHTPQHFPFLARPANRRLRTKLHAALARLVFQQPAEAVEPGFAAFMAPVLAVLQELAAVPAEQLAADARCREALSGALRDLRGVAEATVTRKTYLLLFDALHPEPLLLFARAADAFAALDPDLCSLLFKCLGEVACNRSQRAAFGNSSASGYLLFRAVSAAVRAFGSRTAGAPDMAHPRPDGAGVPDLYRARYKPLAACLACVREALAGGYVNFGVLQLYGDPCLTVLLDTTIRLLLSVPTDHALAYPKLAKPFFAVLEALFASHLPFLAAKDQATFSRLLEVKTRGW